MDRHKHVTGLLKDLIEIPSVFPNEENISKYCADFLKNSEFKVELVEIGKNRHNVVATKGSQRKSILLFGHLDTVPPYNYSKNPYQMETNGDKITGLGSWDMKSGLAIILSCASKIRPKNVGVKIVFSADEENNSLGSHVTYTSDFLKNVLLAVTPEIIDNADESKNKNVILLGRRGRIVFRLEVKGIAGHGASLKGVSAISVASEIVQYLEQLKFKNHDFLGNTTLFVRKIEGTSTSLSLPEKCEILLDIHYVPPYNENSLLAEIESALIQQFSIYTAKGVKISLEIQKRNTPYLKPYITDKNNLYVKKFISLLSNKIKSLRISAGQTVADENIVGSFGVPVVTMGPIGGEAHSLNEWVSKKSIIEIEKIYVDAVQEMVK